MNASKMSAKEKNKFAAKIMDVVQRVPRFNFDGFHYLALAKEELEKYNKTKTKLQRIGEADYKIS